MDEGRIERLESSFRLIAPRGPELIDHFFAHLFSKNPALRPLFPRDMTAQKQKFLASIALVVKNFRRPESLRQPFVNLGRRHVGYKALPEHFPIMRETLIGVMRDMTGPAWNSQFTEDWTTILNLVLAMMLEGRDLELKSTKYAMSAR